MPESRDDALLAEVGGIVDECSVTLAVYGESLGPAEVSERLGCRPTTAFARGDKPTVGSSPSKRGAWFLEVRGAPPDSPDSLTRRLLMHLPRDEQVWAALARDFDVQLRFGLHLEGWNKGFDLAAETVSAMARLRARVVFDIYAYSNDA